MWRRYGLRAAFGLLGLALLALAPRPPLYEGLAFSQAVYDSQGRLLRLSLAEDERYRLRTTLRNIAPALQKATLLYEDRYFYQHYGINPVALVKAAWTTYVQRSTRVGASTITMQLARLRYGIESQRLGGKLYQIYRALQLELHYSKQEILEAYFNLAPYGGNIEGVAAASLIYFNKTADRLSLHEALTLAVIPQSPVYRSLDRGGDNPGLLRARDELISRWAEAYELAPERQELLRQPLQARSRKALPFLAPHFVEAYLQQGHSEQDQHTSLDLSLQQLVERNLQHYVERNHSQGIYNATAMLVDYRDMSIRAMVGSADYFNADIHGQVNGTAALRSPGSTLKPFIYALGMQQGLIHTQSMVKDAPSSFGAYNPENYDRDFSGPLSVTEALVKSRNIPAVDIAARLDSPDLYDLLQQAHLQLPQAKSYYGLSLVLGGAEVSMQSLVRLYAMLANRGQLQPLHWGQAPSHPRREPLLSPEASYLALKMLGENPRPRQAYASSWVRNSIPVYWKTGTSYGYRDAWSVGVFGPYVLAVWVGNFPGEGNPALVGRKIAAPLFFRLVDAIRAQQPQIQSIRPYRPDTVKQVKVCALSGDIATKACSVTRLAGFIPGVSPIHKCQVHRIVHIDSATGLRACQPGRDSQAKVYEFWPSDLLAVFRQAGIARRLPPPYPPQCRRAGYRAEGVAPRIRSPLDKVSYIHRPGEAEQTIAFSAVSDADVRKLYWFLNESYLGTSEAGVPYYWPSRPGQYQVRVIDDHGRGDVRGLRVEVQ